VERVLADSSYEHVPFSEIRKLVDRYRASSAPRNAPRVHGKGARAAGRNPRLSGAESPVRRHDLVTGRDR